MGSCWKSWARCMPNFIQLAWFLLVSVEANRFSTSFYGATNSVNCSAVSPDDIVSAGLTCHAYKFVNGDFNGDGLCDFACWTSLGKVFMRYGTGNGSFRYPQNLYSERRITTIFCGQQDGYFVAVDFNKDGYDDLVCVFDDIPNDRKLRVHVITGKSSDFSSNTREFMSNVIVSSDPFDEYGSTTDKEQFKRRDECTKYNTKQCNHVQKSQYDKLLTPSWCPDGKVHFSDFDGDGFCDIMCHDATENSWTISIMYFVADIRRLTNGLGTNQQGYNYSDILQLRIISSWKVISIRLLPTEEWCDGARFSVSVLDITRDGATDIVCGYCSDTYRAYITGGSKTRDVQLWSAMGYGKFLRVMESDVVSSAVGVDPVVSCTASLKVSNNDMSRMNPCENVTRNAAYLQSDVFSVLDVDGSSNGSGNFCLDPAKSAFLSAGTKTWPCPNTTFIKADVDGNGYCDMICQDNVASSNTSVYVQYLTNDGVTYQTRHNVPEGTAGLGTNFKCPEMNHLFAFDFNGDSHWDLLCVHTNMYLTCGMQLKITYWLANGDSTGFSPDTVPLSRMMKSDLLLGSKHCRPKCEPFSVANGVVTYDTMHLRFEVTCKPGFQLRGRRFIGCASESHYMAAFPLCRVIRPDPNFNMHKGSGLTSVFPPEKFLSSAFDALEVVFSDGIEDCVWTCNANAECISATIDDKMCNLYAYQAKVHKSGTGNMLIILPAHKRV